jgi:uncharacterized protein with HEPN domain
LSSRTDLDWLIDISNSAKRISRALSLKLSIEHEELFFDAIQYNLVCMGEAVRQISIELKLAQSEIPWHLVAGMRNRLTHEYFQVSREQVESVLSNHLDPFVVQCETLATQLPKRID